VRTTQIVFLDLSMNQITMKLIQTPREFVIRARTYTFSIIMDEFENTGKMQGKCRENAKLSIYGVRLCD
jgi:hypothetical protein